MYSEYTLFHLNLCGVFVLLMLVFDALKHLLI